MEYTDHKEHYRIDAEAFDYFDHAYETVDERRRRQMVLRLARPLKDQRILEIGSGSGWFSIAAARQGASVTAVDLSQRNLDRIHAAEPRVTVKLGDAYELPLAGEQFDLITANEVIEHLAHPEQALAHWRQFLTPGGRILVSAPYRERIKYALCIHCNQKTPMNAHLHSFDRARLTAMLEQAGYTVRRVTLYNNRALTTLRFNRLLAVFPWWIWRSKDISWNWMTGKAALMSVVASGEGRKFEINN